MTAQKRLVLGGGGLLVLMSALLLSSIPHQNEGPSYQGKSLNKWVILIGRDYWEDPPSPELRTKAEQAIANIGTNAIPFLVQWIPYEPTGSRTGHRIASMMRKLPGTPLFQFLANPRHRPADDIRARGARNAFRIMGSTASSAIPALSNLVVSSQSAKVKDRAAQALAGIGTSALPTMINLLTNSTDAISSLYVLYAITSLGTNAEPAIPAILHCVTNEQGWIDGTARHALQELSSQSQAFADALVTIHEAPSRHRLAPPDISYEFGPDLPVHLLAAFLTNSQPGIRLAATNALRKTAPHLLTNPPGQ